MRERADADPPNNVASANDLRKRLDRLPVLEVEKEARVGRERIDDLLEQDDARPSEPATIEGAARPYPLGAGSVPYDELPALRCTKVDLDVTNAHRNDALERFKRILVTGGDPATMGDCDRPVLLRRKELELVPAHCEKPAPSDCALGAGLGERSPPPVGERRA